MRTPTKILVSGMILAALVAAVGAMNTARLEGRVKDLEAACVEEGKRTVAQIPKFVLLCEADELVRFEGDSKATGIQSQILNAHRSVQDSGKWPYVLAIVIAVFAAVPWAWYFFLRRVAELRDAIVGKRDV